MSNKIFVGELKTQDSPPNPLLRPLLEKTGSPDVVHFVSHGGTGKSSLAANLIRRLLEERKLQRSRSIGKELGTTGLDLYNDYLATSVPHFTEAHSASKDHLVILNATHSTSEIGVPAKEDNRSLLEMERLKSRLMAERRTASLVRQEADELSKRNADLIATLQRMTETESVLARCVTAKADAKVCLFEKYSGTVSELIGEQVVVVYDAANGEAVKQIYNQEQFIKDRLPREGEEV